MILLKFWNGGKLSPMLVHLWSQYWPVDSETQRRQTVAQSSWAKQPWHDRPVVNAELNRVWRENGRSVPYIRDLFDAGCERFKDDDIICYTNSDIIMRSDACFQIAAVMQATDAALGYRFDFHHRLSTGAVRFPVRFGRR